LPRPIPGRPPAPTGGRGPPAGCFAPGAGFVSSGAGGLAPAAAGFEGGAAGPLAGAFAEGFPFIEAPQNGHSTTSSSRTEALQAGQVRKSMGVGRGVEKRSSSERQAAACGDSQPASQPLP
jgi:hypothetical protein